MKKEKNGTVTIEATSLGCLKHTERSLKLSSTGHDLESAVENGLYLLRDLLKKVQTSKK